MKKSILVALCLCIVFCLSSCDDLIFREVKEEQPICDHIWITKVTGGSVTIPASGNRTCTPCTITRTCINCGEEVVSYKDPTLELDYTESGCEGILDSFKGKEIVIPATVNINNIDYPVTMVTNLADLAFGFDGVYRSITSVLLNESITTIDEFCFEGWRCLESVTIPTNAKIGDSAFCNCYGLRSLFFLNPNPEIGLVGFGSCYSLTDVYPASVVTENLEEFDSCYVLLNKLDDEGVL